MAGAILTGIVVVRRNGQSLRAKEGKATLMLGGFEQVPVYADGVLQGCSRKPVASKVTMTVVHDSTVDLIAISQDINVTIEFACDSGPTYIISNAFIAKPPEIVGAEGDVQLEYDGQAAIQR